MHKTSLTTRIRLITLVSLLVASLLSLYQLITYFEQRGQLMSHLNQVAETTAQRLSRQLADPLWSIDEQQIAATVESEMSQPELASVQIIDPSDGRVLFQQNRDTDRPGYLFDKQDLIIAEQKIVTEVGEPIGLVKVNISLGYMQTVLVNSLWQQAFRLILLGVVLVVTCLLIIEHQLIQPARRAIDAVRSTTGSEIDQLLKTTRNSELQFLLTVIADLRRRLQGVKAGQG